MLPEKRHDDFWTATHNSKFSGGGALESRDSLGEEGNLCPVTLLQLNLCCNKSN